MCLYSMIVQLRRQNENTILQLKFEDFFSICFQLHLYYYIYRDVMLNQDDLLIL